MIIKGNIYIVSAPSGAGKSSLIKALIKTKLLLYNTQVSISYTTRAIRPEEINGQHYFFVSVEKFEHMISENAFLEYAQVFDNYYGTARENVEQIIATGSDIFLDIDWQGAQQIRQKIPNAPSIFILPPSKKELNRRLHRRGQDSEEIINIRMAQAVNDINHITEYDYLIINDNFNTALLDLQTIIRAKRLSFEWQKKCHKALINKLLAD